MGSNSEKLNKSTIQTAKEKGKKQKSRWLIWLAALVLLAVITTTGISTYADIVLVHPAKASVTTNPGFYGLQYEDVSFTSTIDHLKLYGWFIPAQNPSNRTIIVAHGHADNRVQTDAGLMFMLQRFTGSGFNVLTFDFRDSGESQGAMDTVGQFEQRDLEGAIDYMKTRPNNQGEHIGFLGFSMGAAISIIVAGQDKRVEGVVADSSFADLKQYLEENTSKYSHLPQYPFTPLMEMLSKPLTGFDPSTVQPIKSIPMIAPRPILLIHGEADTQIDVKNSKELYAAANNPNAQLWLVPNADHVQSFKTEPEAYLDHVVTFFEESLGK